MALTHDGFDIPGTHEDLAFADWQYSAQYHRMFGLNGQTVLDGGRAGRAIDVSIWIWDNYDLSELLVFLGNLDGQIGKTGSLVELGTISRTIPNVQFLGFSLTQMHPDGGLGWFADGVLHFLQLGPE